jgi:hypothetical protein
VAWAALIVSWAIGGIGAAAYLLTRPTAPARSTIAPALSAPVTSSSAAAAEAATQAPLAASSSPAIDNDPPLAVGPWWLSQKSKTGDCTDKFNPAGALLLGGGVAPWLKANRDLAGNLISVEIHSGGALDTHLTFFRDKAACDAFDLAQFKRDCERVNADGYGVDCAALAREDPARLAETQAGDAQ